jgi:uncharacterized protein YjbI with pentapeptide repeats
MNRFEKGFESPKLEALEPKKLTREEIESRLANGENLENLNLTDLNLAGLNLEGKSFRGSDIRGMSLYREEKKEDGTLVEIQTNIKGADFTDATIADFGPEVFFERVNAEGAIFGFTEDLISRRNRHIEYKKSGRAPGAEDTGELLKFNGSEGNFKKTKWINVDFGGGSGYESTFSDADLSESIMEGSDLTGMDFSTTKIDSIKIKDPMSLSGLIINEQQIPIMVQAIELTDEKAQREFLEEVKNKGPQKALEDFFLVVIVEIKK